MIANGFQAGQSGVGVDIGIVYCAPYNEFRRRFPELAPTIHYGDEGACTDLNIYAGTGTGATLREIRFDGITLKDLLAEQGIEFANEADTISSMPAQDAAIRLRSILDKLFSRHAAT